MAGNPSGGQNGGAAGTKRPAGGNLGNGNTKRANTGIIDDMIKLVPVDDLLNVDFLGLSKLYHRHDRQVGDLGNPFQAVERWARRALPKAQWDSNKHVGHWMRSEKLGVVYMFKNGYCYDNGREFVTVPVYGRWLEYQGFKHFKSDEGAEWYTILDAGLPSFRTGNPESPFLDVGSWTMSRFGKPVIVGKDNKFYQSVLDAFRERNPATITNDGENEKIEEIEVPIKSLTMTNELELEPPRPYYRDMEEYGPYLRLLGGSHKHTASQQPTESPEVVMGESEHGEATHKDTSATGKPSGNDQYATSEETHPPPSPPVPHTPKTPEEPGETTAKIGQGLTTPGSDKFTGGAIDSKTSSEGTHTPTGKKTEEVPGTTEIIYRPNSWDLHTPEKEQKSTTPTPGTNTSVAVDNKGTTPTSSQTTGKKHTAETTGSVQISNNFPTASTGHGFGSIVPHPTGTQVQQPGTTGSSPNANVAHTEKSTTGAANTNAKTGAQAFAQERATIEAQIAAELADREALKSQSNSGSHAITEEEATIEAQLAAELKLQLATATATAAELADREALESQSNTGSQPPVEGGAIAQAALIDSSCKPFSVEAQEAFKHFVENEAKKDAVNPDEVNARTQTSPKDQSKVKPEELHGQSQRLSFGVEFEFVMPVVLEEWLNGSDIDEELLPALNVLPLSLDVRMSRRNFDYEVNEYAESNMRERWVDKQILATLISLGVPVIDDSGRGDKGPNVLVNAHPKAENISSDRAYWGWKIQSDDSVEIPSRVSAAYSFRKTHWIGVELVSPAYWATPKNLGEVRRVLRGLSSKLCFVTPETSGLHVHVGRGKSSFSLAELKRLAGLCYAAGPLLSQLHPASRHVNQWCKSNRFYSSLAHGMNTENAIVGRRSPWITCSIVRQGGLPQEPLANPQRLGGATKESGQRPADTPRFKRAIKRGELPSEAFSQDKYENQWLDDMTKGVGESGKPPPPRAIDSAIDELWRAPTASDLVNLFQGLGDRFFAYNFTRYMCEDYVGNLASVKSYPAGLESSSNSSGPENGGEHGCEKRSRTVEFRQAAATLDPDSIVAWVRVVVNLTCVAVHTTHDEYARLVHCCAKAEREPAWYDAFDLLVDLDMPRTAQFIQDRMLSRASRTPWAALPP
ncbi:uncharacterized protein PG986_006206 [Apiospora aurea]|uniref:Amidoligase enzyme n=1 Tax=Apiospora aurea TaxID=335848 RepID=A0ABR1QK60_9PEZI